MANERLLKVGEDIKRAFGKNSKESKIFGEVFLILANYINSESARILDIASDKEPKLSSMLAQALPESYFTHFKDDEVRIKKVKTKYSKIENLDIVYSSRNLNPPYDIAFALFTLHELRNPKKTLKKVYKMLKESGRMIIIDYDLKWFPKLAKEQEWGKDERIEEKYEKNRINRKQKKLLEKRRFEKVMMRNFSKYIFTEGNEKKVSREEESCIEHHAKIGLEDYVEYCSGVGFKELQSGIIEYVSLPLNDTLLKKSKLFLYVGEKPKILESLLPAS